VDLHHLPEDTHSFSTESLHARPVDIPNWSAWGDLHSQGCSGLSRTGLLFPVNHTPWNGSLCVLRVSNFGCCRSHGCSRSDLH